MPHKNSALSSTHIRLIAVSAAIITIAAGLGVRMVLDGPVAKYAGTALYTVLIFWLVIFIAPRMRPILVAAIALAFSWAVEIFQLTSYPAVWSSESIVARLVFGSTFHAPDLFWYAVGALSVWLFSYAIFRYSVKD